MRPEPGFSPVSWLGALSRDAPSFVAVSLAAPGAANGGTARVCCLPVRCMLGKARAEDGFLAVLKPGQGVGGNAHSSISFRSRWISPHAGAISLQKWGPGQLRRPLRALVSRSVKQG